MTPFIRPATRYLKDYEMSADPLPLVETPPKTRVQQTSIDAHKLVKSKRTEDKKRVVHLIKTGQLAGMDGLTGREVCEHYLATFGEYFPPSDASARLNELVKAGFVVREKKRPCSVTGITVWVNHCPMRQAALV